MKRPGGHSIFSKNPDEYLSAGASYRTNAQKMSAKCERFNVKKLTP